MITHSKILSPNIVYGISIVFFTFVEVTFLITCVGELLAHLCKFPFQLSV